MGRVNIFKNDNPESRRIALAARLIDQCPDRIPVIVQSSKEIKLKRQKFLVPKQMTMAHLLNEIRNQTEISGATTIFLFADKTGSLIPINRQIIDIYEKYHDDDGFLYINLAIENTFGELSKLFDPTPVFEVCRQISVVIGMSALLDTATTF